MTAEVGSRSAPSALERVDAALSELAQKPPRSPDVESLLYALADASLEHIDVAPGSSDERPLDGMIAAPTGSQGNRFLAVVLLRLLAVQPDAITETTVEHKVCAWCVSAKAA